MPVAFAFRRLAGLLLTSALATGPVSAQDPEFYEVPYAEDQWTYGRRLDESQLRYCVDRRDPGWEVAADIADAIGSADCARNALDVVVAGALDASVDAGITETLDAAGATEGAVSTGIRTDSDD